MKLSYRQALALAQEHEMDLDPNVFLYGLDVSDHKEIFGSVKGLFKKFGERRVFSTPLSEDCLTGVGIGAALSGLRPIQVHIRADFLLLCMNQLVNMASNIRYLSGGKLKCPLLVRAVIGRGWGQGAQHSKTIYDMFGSVPGIKISIPTSPQDAYTLTRLAVRCNDPVIQFEHRWLYDIEGEVDLEHKDKLETPKVVIEGKDGEIHAKSWDVIEAVHASKILKEKHNVSITVIDRRTIDRTEEARCPVPTTRCLETLFYSNAGTIVRDVERTLQLQPCDLSTEQFNTYEKKFIGPF